MIVSIPVLSALGLSRKKTQHWPAKYVIMSILMVVLRNVHLNKLCLKRNVWTHVLTIMCNPGKIVFLHVLLCHSIRILFVLVRVLIGDTLTSKIAVLIALLLVNSVIMLPVSNSARKLHKLIFIAESVF